MENSNKLHVRKLLHSFGFAWTGIKDMLRTEQNARIHTVVTFGVVVAGLVLGISRLEWCIVALCVGLVFAAEAFNTVCEKLVDHHFPELHETARFAKDVAAGGVLIAALMAVVCGILIFLPKLLALC
jgi:diacylglycerol kinase